MHYYIHGDSDEQHGCHASHVAHVCQVAITHHMDAHIQALTYHMRWYIACILIEHLFKEKDRKHVGIKEKYIPNNQEIKLAHLESFSFLKIEVDGSSQSLTKIRCHPYGRIL